MRKENQKMFYLDDKECVSTLDLYISTADTDRTYDATLPFFFASCQEIAGLHATEKGMGLKSMTEEEQKTWMITREKIKFNYWPHWGETIKMRSWPQKGDRRWQERLLLNEPLGCSGPCKKAPYTPEGN